LDEPFKGLDSDRKRQVMDLVAGCAADRVCC
jgi:ABC-type multidrug transport system ATPase subunit